MSKVTVFHILNGIYLNTIKDTVEALLDSQFSFSEKIAGLHDVFTSENTQRLIAYDGIESEKEQLFKAVAEWITNQQDGMAKEQKKYDLDDPLLTELEIILNRALGKSDEEMFKYLADVKKRRPRVSEKIDINAHICNTMAEYPLLTGMAAETAVFLNNAVCAVLRDDLQTALDEVVSLPDNKVPTEHIESYLMFAQYVCASAEYAEGWLFFKKMWANFLLDKKCVDEARSVIDELEEMLPGDTEINAMKVELESIRDSQPTSGDEAGLPQNGCDKEFYKLINKLQTQPLETLLADAAKSASVWRTSDEEYFDILSKWYKDWYQVGAFNTNDQGFVQYFGSKYQYLKNNAGALIDFYEKLGNYRSKYQLKTMLQFWLDFTPKMGKHGVERTFEHYFDLDIIKCDEHEVYVDCGSFDGDTILSFIKQYGGKYKSIYGYELTPSTYKKALENTEGFERIYIRNAGVANENGTMTFIDNADAIGGGNRLLQGGNVVCNIVKMDDDITENVTFIKMDIEGAEIAALVGAANHIKRSKPKLAISLYHKLSDLVDIPKLVHQLVPEYKFYFQHCPFDFPFPTEYVLLAVCDNG